MRAPGTLTLRSLQTKPLFSRPHQHSTPLNAALHPDPKGLANRASTPLAPVGLSGSRDHHAWLPTPPIARKASPALPLRLDWPAFCVDTFFMVALNDAYSKLAALSDERARRVVELIEDLAELEAREDAEDLAAAHESLAEYEKTGEAITLDELDKRLRL